MSKGHTSTYDDDSFLDDIIGPNPCGIEPSANVDREHVENRSRFPLRVVEPARTADEYVNRAMATGGTYRIRGSIPPSMLTGVAETDDFERVPISLERYREPLTTEDYVLKETGDDNIQSEPSVQSRLTWDDSIDPYDETTRSGQTTPIRERDKCPSSPPPQARERTTSFPKEFRDALRTKKQQEEEESRKRRMKRVRNIVSDKRGHIENNDSPEEDIPFPSSTRDTFNRTDVEQELSHAIVNLRNIANQCLKGHKRGGNDILKRLQKETNMVLEELAEVMGTSPNECFLCLFGNREFDKSTHDKLNGMYMIFSNLLYKDVTIRAIAIEMYAYYMAQIYNPGVKAGLSFPKWSWKGIEEHIRLHINDPRVKSFLRLEKVGLAIDVLGTQATYFDEEDGRTKCDYVAMRLLHTYIKLEDDLQKRDFRTMMGYDESLAIKPGQAWLETRVNVTKKKRT